MEIQNQIMVGYFLISKAYVDTVAMSKAYADSENGKDDITIADKANKIEVFHHDVSGNLNMEGKRNRESQAI